MASSNPRHNRGTTAIDGAMALIILLLIVQVWLLSATLDVFLSGHHDAALPGAIFSGVLFLSCGALYRFVVRLERQAITSCSPSPPAHFPARRRKTPPSPSSSQHAS